MTSRAPLASRLPKSETPRISKGYGLGAFACVFLALLCCSHPGRAQETPAATPQQMQDHAPERNNEFTQKEIDTALDKVRADPNLANERKVKSLRWSAAKEKEDEDAKDKKTSRRRSGLLRWVADFFSAIASAGQVTMWLLLGVAAALLVLLIVRIVRNADMSGKAVGFVAPTHVRELDIRPESLPDDIGGEAFALWRNGEQRAALSLLYRGLLSRLAHVHGVPIRHSTTEGDCIELAQRHLRADAAAYVLTLVKTWQRAVYGGLLPNDAELETICQQFAGHLNSPANKQGIESAPDDTNAAKISGVHA